MNVYEMVTKRIIEQLESGVIPYGIVETMKEIHILKLWLQKFIVTIV